MRGLLDPGMDLTPISVNIPQPQQQAEPSIGLLERLAMGFIPQTYSMIQQEKARRGAPQSTNYDQLAEYWAQQGDPEKANQYAQLAQAGKPRMKEAFSREVGINPDTGEAELAVVYRDGTIEWTGVKPQANAGRSATVSAAPGKLPVGMMWDEGSGRAVPIPGVPQKAPAGARSAGGGGSGGGAVRTKPLNATEFKELAETEDVLASSQSALSTLDRAFEINDQAYSGLTAKPRAVIESQFGGSARADATIQLDNLIQNQAMSSMKAIFGGNPTEGERAILLQLQASSEKTPAQRAEILKRARAAAEARIKNAATKADAIRRGSYGTTAYQPPSRQAAQAERPMEKLPPASKYPGAIMRDTQYGKRFRSNGKTWEPI